MRKKLLRRCLVILLIAAAGAIAINQYFRQLVFGPRIHGTPLCAWQERIRRQVLPQRDDNWLNSIAKLFQPKDEALPYNKLDLEQKTYLWLSLIDDSDPAMRAQAVNALWGANQCGSRLWGGDLWTVNTYLRTSLKYEVSGYSTILFDGTASTIFMDGLVEGPGGLRVPKSPDVAPHLVRMLDDADDKVRGAVFSALATQGKRAAPAFPRLFELLSHADPDRRTQAITTLNAAHPKTRAWLDQLIAMLDDGDVGVRQTAASALGAWNDRRMAVAAGPRLVQSLRDPDTRVRLNAASALASLRMHLAEATEALRWALRHADPAVRGDALSHLFSDAAPALFDEMVRCARFDSTVENQRAALNSLRYCGAKAVPILVNFLRHPDLQTKTLAVQTLGNLGAEARAAVPFLLLDLEEFGSHGVQALASIGDADAVPKLVELLDHRDLRGNALAALQSLGPPARAALPKLLELVRDGDAEIGPAALQTLLALEEDHEATFAMLAKRLVEAPGANDANLWHNLISQYGADARNLLPEFVRRLNDSREDKERIQIEWMNVLSAMGPGAASAVPTLAKIADGPDTGPRSAAIGALGSIASNEELVVPLLIRSIQREKNDYGAVDALVPFGKRAEAALPHLRPLLESDDQNLRRSAAGAMLHCARRLDDVLPHLMPLLTGDDQYLRQTTAMALLQTTHPLEDMLPRLLPLLQDEEESIRSTVARALGEFGPAARAAIPELAKLLDDDSQYICDTVLEALARIEP